MSATRKTTRSLCAAAAIAGVLASVALPAAAQEAEHHADPTHATHDEEKAGAVGRGEHGEHGEHGDGPVTVRDVFSSTAFWATVINFAIFVFLLTRIARKPLSGFLSTRRDEIAVGLAEGKRLKAEAEATKAEYAARMAQIDDELAALRAEIVRSGQKERDRIMAEAEERADRMRRDAERAIEQRLKQFRQDLTAETVEASLVAAKRLLRAQMTPDDQQRLADGYLGDLQARVKAALDRGAPS